MIKTFHILTVAFLFFAGVGVGQVGASHDSLCTGLTESECRTTINQICRTEVGTAAQQACSDPMISHLDSLTGNTSATPPPVASGGPAVCGGTSGVDCGALVRNRCALVSTRSACEQVIRDSCPGFTGTRSQRAQCSDTVGAALAYARNGDWDGSVAAAASNASVPTTGSAGSGLFGITWTNPTPFNSFSELVTGVLNALMIIAIPIITLFIIYAGFLYVTARGNAEQVRKATTALVYALIGAVMIIGALTISTIIGNTIAQF